MSLDFQTLAQVFSGRVLNTVAEGMLLVTLSWLGLRLIRAASAVTRFAVWFSTLAAVAVMPFLLRSASSFAVSRPSLELSSSWARDLFVGWIAVSSLLLVRLGFSLWHVQRLRSQCWQINSKLYPELMTTMVSLSRSRSIQLLISHKVRVPAALGFFHPAVILPAWTLEQLSPEELNPVLLHELAHLRRYDDWTNLAQQILQAIFFFHPAVWFIESRLTLEREMACDDFVLQQTANASSYAASLISLAEKALAQNGHLGHALALAQNALGRVRQISARVTEILRPKHAPANRWRQMVAAGSVLAVALVATPYAPEMVSFRNDAPVASQAKSTYATRPSAAAIKASMSVPVSKPSARTKRVPAVLPVRVKIHRAEDPRLALTKAKVEQTPQPELLLFRSTRLEGFGSPVWSFAVWRVTYQMNGTTHVETIVMSSI